MPTTPYGGIALSGELEKLARAVSGERNDTLNRCAFKVAQLVTGGHVEHDDAYAQLAAVARQIGLTESEIRATLASAQRGGQAKPRDNVPDPVTGARPGYNGFGQPSNGAGSPNTNGRVDVAVSTAEEPPNYDDLYLTRSQLAELPQPTSSIADVLDERTLFAIVGRDRSYKSFLALDWLACLATGKPWQGHEVAEPMKVLYVVGEGAYGLDSRLNAWEVAWQTKIPDDMFHIRRAPVNLFKRGYDCSDLFDRIEREGYGVVIFDTLQRMSGGADANFAKDASVIVETMDMLRRANERIAIGIVAHSGKSDVDIRGSSSLEDDLDIVWRVKRDDEESDTVTVELSKRKDGPEGTRHELRPSPVTGTGSIVLSVASGKSEKPPAHHLALLKALARAGDAGESRTTLLDLLNISTRKLYEAADYCEEHGWLERTMSGQRRLFKITPSGLSVLEKIDETELGQP